MKNMKLLMKLNIILIVALIATFPTAALADKVQFQFTPRTSVKGEYTDNVFLSSDNERDEYIVTVSAGFTAGLVGKTSGIEVSYDPAYEFYEDFDENDGWTHDAQLFVYNDFSQRTRFELTNRFLLLRDPLGEDELLRDEEVVIEGDTTSRTNREKYYSNTTDARITHQFGVDDEFSVRFLYSFLRNNDDETEDNDRYEPSVSYNYWFGPKFGIETQAIYTKGEFDQDAGFTGTPTDDFDNFLGSIEMIMKTSRHFSIFVRYEQIYRDYDGDNDDDYLTYSPSAGLLYLVEEGLSLRLGLGYYYQDLDNNDDNEAFYLNSEIDKRWDYRRGFINLNGSSGLDQNNFGAENLGLERFAQVSGEAQYDFLRNLSGNISGSVRYSDVVNSEESDGIKEELITQGGAGLSYLPFRWMTWDLNYTYSKYAADGDKNYDENRVALTLTLQPDQPWKF